MKNAKDKELTREEKKKKKIVKRKEREMESNNWETGRSSEIVD
jgi:hypothetical protein